MERVTAKIVTVSVFFLVTPMFFALTSQALGAAYKAIDLTPPSGYSYSYASGAAGTQQVGYGSGSATAGQTHALLWNSSPDNFVDLNPAEFDSSRVLGIGGTQQVGYGYGLATGNAKHALLWNGTADSFIDLNPSGASESYATATNGVQQVGYNPSPAGNRALLWSGTAASYVSLHPSGYLSSRAYGISGSQQVGYIASTAWGGPFGWAGAHAFLWNGTADNRVDLHPSAGFVWSEATGISGAQQVGWGYMNNTLTICHALLWNGTADNFVDLNPGEYSSSRALATNGTQQVGWGGSHALLWNGSASSYIDLSQFLPVGFGSSCACGIDEYGNIAGYAKDTSGNYHALLWQPIPEPATLFLLALGVVMLRKRKK